ncbi:hypothetical protein PC112_g13912 [Phytophthora cactorum]|nr:hypothetical protein PC112_g13912 [Phytophthora cactorum]
MMTEGADRCPVLNSEEDSDGCDEPEDDADSDGSADWVCDWDIGDLSDEELEEAPEEIPNSIWSLAAKDAKMLTAMRHSGREYDPSKFGPDPTYADLYDGPYGPSDSVLDVADDLLALLFYFMPPQLWRQIAIESNTYHTQSITKRARAIRAQQRRNGGNMEELAEIRRRLSNVRNIEPWKVLRVVALLIARMLVPIHKGIAAHWSTAKLGSLPTNRFGLYMPKNRFFHIVGYMHFSNNKSPEAHRDRAWKIRPVVDLLQRTFARGYKPPSVISFDEATLPSRSRFNPVRVFNKDKPHKWGTKGFVAACAKTTYCMRLEIYCGAKNHLRTPVPQDNNSGEAAVLRNMNALLPPTSISPWRLVVTDRFYTSVKLALELLHRRMYLTGTIQTDRSGFAKEIITNKTVNRKMVLIPPQGTIKLAQNKKFPQVTAAIWMDRNPVHMLTSGGSRKEGTVTEDAERQCATQLQDLEVLQNAVPGASQYDVRGRLHRVSTPSQTNGKSPPKHFAFFEELMEQLLAVDSVEAFAEIEVRFYNISGINMRTGTNGAVAMDERHRLEESPDTIEGEQGVKKRQRSCKACALHKVKPRKFTKYFCPECSSGNKRDGRDTCHRVWHLEWNNGNDIPRELLQSHKTRDRPRESGGQPTAGSDGGEGGDVDANDDDEDLAGDQP